MHQDVWSRYSGGSGAPGWTLELAGMDLSDDGAALEATGAAFLHGVKGGRLPGERGLWSTGYSKLACASLSTLFWGGETFAPTLKVGPKGINIQSYLQDAYLGAYDQLVKAVGDLDTVVGFEMMNEPHTGYIGMASIDTWNYNTDLHLGVFPSPIQGMVAGAGHEVDGVPVYTRSWPYPTRASSKATLNAGGKAKAWTNDGPTAGQCPWEREGVWKWSADKKAGIALQQDYFTRDRKGNKVEFYRDFYFPFIRRWEAVVARRAPKKSVMLEPLPNEYAPVWPADVRPKNFVYAPHWYDLHAMFNKSFGNWTVNVQGLSRGMFILRALYYGDEGAKDNYSLQIATLVREARDKFGMNVPIVFGECGVPIDLNGETAFASGNWKWQERMLDAVITAMERSLVAFNLWNYNPLNTDALGDDWNAENFSWYSDANRQRTLDAAPASEAAVAATSPDTGGRLLDALVRPYAIATAGTKIISSRYTKVTQLYSLRFTDNAGFLTDKQAEINRAPTARVTELFVPSRIYKPGQFKWSVSLGGRIVFDHAAQRAWVWFDDSDDAIAEHIRTKRALVRCVDIWVQDPVDERPLSAYLALLLVLCMVGFVFANEVMAARYGKGWVTFL